MSISFDTLALLQHLFLFCHGVNLFLQELNALCSFKLLLLVSIRLDISSCLSQVGKNNLLFSRLISQAFDEQKLVFLFVSFFLLMLGMHLSCLAILLQDLVDIEALLSDLVKVTCHGLLAIVKDYDAL